MNQLLHLKLFLKSKGLYKEAFAIDSLLKSAQSLDAVVGLHDERDLVQRDSRERQKYGDEESLRSDQDAWQKSIKMLGDSIVLIPFDYKELSSDDLRGIAEVFGVTIKDDLSWKSLSSEAQLLTAKNGIGSGNNGNVEIFKIKFPKVWNRISAKLSENNLAEGDVIFMLYNQDYMPGDLEGFEKTPFYFAHDIGHSIFDDFNIGDRSGYKFMDLIGNFINNFCKFYSNEFDESLCNFVDKDSNYFLQQIFNSRSGGDDSFMDIFAEVAAGTFEINIPDTIEYDDYDFLFDESKSSEAEEMISELKNNLNLLMKKGFLSKYKGKIVIQEI